MFIIYNQNDVEKINFKLNNMAVNHATKEVFAETFETPNVVYREVSECTVDFNQIVAPAYINAEQMKSFMYKEDLEKNNIILQNKIDLSIVEGI